MGLTNKERKKYNKKYYQNNKEKCQENYKESRKKYYENGKEIVKKKQREYYHNNTKKPNLIKIIIKTMKNLLTNSRKNIEINFLCSVFMRL